MNKGNEPDAPLTDDDDDDTSDTSSESELAAIAEEADDIRNEPPVIEEETGKKKKKKRKFFRLPFKKKTKKVNDSEGHIEAESNKIPERRKSSRYTCGTYA